MHPATMPHHVKETPEMRARLERERAALTAEGSSRDYRFINGLGDVYRVQATSAISAIRNIRIEHRVTAQPHKLQVFENGAWVHVL